jgi:hypothetical protein
MGILFKQDRMDNKHQGPQVHKTNMHLGPLLLMDIEIILVVGE